MSAHKACRVKACRVINKIRDRSYGQASTFDTVTDALWSMLSHKEVHLFSSNKTSFSASFQQY